MNPLRILAAATTLGFLNVSCSLAPRGGFGTGMPFGAIGPRDISGLHDFGDRVGIDFPADLQAAYSGDAAALDRVFALSRRFDRLDANARAYGQALYSALLNLGAQGRLTWFSQAVARQHPEVRQRVRDFLYYDATLAPRAQRAEAEAAMRRTAPDLFPDDYTFGSDNPLFERQ